MKPEFPLISIYKNAGLDIFKNDSVFRKISTSMLIFQNPDENKLYDPSGKCWTFMWVNDKIKNDFRTRLLAKTFYNPAITVDIEWKLIGNYRLDDLKNDICSCVDKDDDIITQFEEGDIIKNEIRNCHSFEDILSTLNKFVFEVNEEELWADQEKRNKKDNQNYNGA